MLDVVVHVLHTICICIHRLVINFYPRLWYKKLQILWRASDVIKVQSCRAANLLTREEWDLYNSWWYIWLYSSIFAAGDMIAVGSQNGSVYLFRVSRDGFSYKKWNKIRGSQPLTQLDWSTDGCYLQTVTADYDLVFCEYILMSVRVSNGGQDECRHV